MEPTKEQLEQLKSIELEMLKAFIKACDMLNVKYFLLGGTLLGAVRHKGFIPWDDDIDVGMLREDYEIFIAKGASYLPDNLFIQNVYSDENYTMCFSKIRNNNTTFIESTVSHLKMNHGVFIDIFPLDYYPDEAKKQRELDFKKKIYDIRIAHTYNILARPMKVRLLEFFLSIIYPSVRTVSRKRDFLYKEVAPSKRIANYGGAWGKKEIVPKDWYGEGVFGEFEGVTVRIPAQYDKWLSQVYGDYMKLPPIEKRVGHHYVDVIDLNRSYIEYGEV